MKGRIEHYNAPRGYGFIRGEHQTQVEKPGYFFHVSNIVSGVLPAVGREVSFEVGKTAKGFTALNVYVIGAASTNVLSGFAACAENGGKAGV